MWTAPQTKSSAAPPQPPAAPFRPPRITANRRQLDDRFPFLGFTVMTEGLPYYEVQLVTDLSLFLPENKEKLTAENSFNSRAQGGLIRATDADSLYTVPAAVLLRLRKARAIYYNVVAYADAAGSGAVSALPPESLAKSAPFVSVVSDFRGHTLAAVLCVAPDQMKRVNGQNSQPASMAVETATAIDPEEDRAEGEDGYELASAQSSEGFFADDEDRRAAPASLAESPSAAEEGAAHVDETAYSDGFEDVLGEVSQFSAAADAEAPGAWSTGADENDAPPAEEDGEPYTADRAKEQSSAFPAGAHAPEMLEDEDYELAGEGALGRAADEDEHQTTESYGMANDAGASEPEYESLDAPPVGATPATPPQPLTVSVKKKIISAIAPFESGRDAFAAINADGEFRGRFGDNHPANGRYHVGLSFGIMQFTQDSGMLGRLLSMMQARDPQKFRQIFGAQAGDLLRVTNADGPSSANSPGGRSARVQPVGGKDLWEEPWVSRFRAAAAHIPFQAAQNELAASAFLDPMLPFSRGLGLDTDRALAIVVDRAVQMGVPGGQHWLIEAAGPVQTAAQLQQALSALGHADLQAFQRSVPELEADGQWGPPTHAAMTRALRALGAPSPVPIPTREQMLDAIERRAAGTPWERRVQQLRASNVFTDTVYVI